VRKARNTRSRAIMGAGTTWLENRDEQITDEFDMIEYLGRMGVLDEADRLYESGVDHLPTITVEEARARMARHCGAR
jgi:hypothetical protein